MNDLYRPALHAVAPTDALSPAMNHRALPDAGATWWWLVGGVALMALLSLWLRPLLPVDETRYASVAWEMWRDGHFLLPTLEGEPYAHKPPLLFWLVHAGWALGGVNAVWPRLIGPLATLACLWLLARLGARLWPAHGQIGTTAGFLFLGSVFIALYGTAFMFDLPLLAMLCLGWIALHDAVRRGRWRDWLGFGLAFAAALLTKGPVAAVYLLPPLLALRLWAPPEAARLAWPRLLAALALALALPLAWLWLADRASGGELLRQVLGEQTLGRVRGDLGHPRPFHWYLPWLPLIALPWTLWPPAWRALRAGIVAGHDRGIRFLAVTLAGAFLVLSGISGKQVHYLIPLLALGALWLARGLADHAGARRLAILGLAFGMLLLLGAGLVLGSRYDLSDAGRHVGRQQQAGRAVAYVGNYQGEFGFLGRLRAPVAELRPDQASAWLAAHPEGLVVVRRKRLDLRGAPAPEYRQPYKTGELLMFRAGELARSGSGFREPDVPGDG
ncbi:ArnT family glycosyltransferase [Arenimonas fontis]|uniref:Glycosyltransferase RgtA/B/C/D-like domain-containing protein n=1 Tax=Arenimonas fontis TaxID=2608255 RepID=A0A5B2ZAD4_9GAMM|nr:glycosyltransferase family 39 protein [Arenimonas fontis]KAA2285106.1 hypothetical protein F0415_07640 [Arenimonas fontis]